MGLKVNEIASENEWKCECKKKYNVNRRYICKR